MSRGWEQQFKLRLRKEDREERGPRSLRLGVEPKSRVVNEDKEERGDTSVRFFIKEQSNDVKLRPDRGVRSTMWWLRPISKERREHSFATEAILVSRQQ